MHTLKMVGYVAHFNSDFSGDIIVQRCKADGSAEEVAKLPFSVFVSVVGERVKRERMAKLEKTDPIDVIYRGWS